VPLDPSQRGGAIRLDARGEWEMQKSPSAQASGDTGVEQGGPPASSSAHVEAPAATPDLLTPAEKAFIDRWRDKLSISNFAALMQMPRSRIGAYLQRSNQADAAQAPGSREAARSNQPAADSRATQSQPFQSIRGTGPTMQARIFGLLTSRPDMSIAAVARECRVARQVVYRLARANRLQRELGALNADTRSNLIDDLMRFPGKSSSAFTRLHRVRRPVVNQLRVEFGRIRQDWERTRRPGAGERRIAAHPSASPQPGRSGRETPPPDLRLPHAGQMGSERDSAIAAGASSSVMPGRRPITAADRIAEFMLRYPGDDVGLVARAYGATGEQVDQIASDVRSTVQAWHDLQQTGTQLRLSVIVAPLTERERQYILNWRSALSTDTLATIMHKPKEVIDAFVRTQEHLATTPERDTRTQHASPATWALVEWMDVSDADLASGQGSPRVAYGDAVQAFVDRWRSRLSARNLAVLLTLPQAVIDAHLQLRSPHGSS
jgi:hypothetical protein